jgi:hypothetical protein
MDRQSPDPREVIAGLLGDERFLKACTERDMGAVFRMLNARGAVHGASLPQSTSRRGACTTT